MLNKTLIETTVIALVALLYLLVVIIFERLFQISPASRHPAALVLLFLGLVVFFGPLRNRLHRWASQRFASTDPDLQDRLQQYTHTLLRLPLQTERLLAFYLEQVKEVLAPSLTHVFWYDTNVGAYAIHRALASPLARTVQVRFAPDDDLVARLTEARRALVLDRLADDFPTAPIGAEELARLAILETAVVVPLHSDDRLLGWLALGARSGGQPYTPSELDYLERLSTQTAVILENAQLLETAHRHAAQLATLNEVSQTITSTLDLDTALHRIMNMAVEILVAEAGSLFLVDDSGQALTFAVVLGPTGDQLLGATIAMGEGIVGTVAKTGRPLIINDVHADPRWNVSFDEATDFKTRSILCVPMVTQGKVVGVIEVINKRDGSDFDEEEQGILTAFAVQAAIAIVNARRFTTTDQALAERVQELQFLQTIDRELNSSLDLDHILDLTLAYALEALNTSMGLVGLLTPDANGLLFLASRGFDLDLEQYRHTPWPLERGIIGRVARTGEMALVPDVQADPDYVTLADCSVAQLTVPLVREEQVLGVISLAKAREDAQPFAERDVEFVRRLADHAAVAVLNAHLYEQVKAANEAKTEFMSIASHELKIPMTSIKGYAKLLQLSAAGSLNEQQVDFLKVISANVDRMDRLVSDLLDVSRIESGRLRLDRERVLLSELVDEVLQSVETELEARQLAVEVNVPNLLPPVWADHGRLFQVMNNLVSNAYKYTPQGGRIKISAATGNSAPTVVVHIQDSGFGIPAEEQPQIFGKFFRSADSRVRDVPGTGLGLAITKSLVEMHGGQIWFESSPGQGSTFSFSLPMADPAAAP